MGSTSQKHRNFVLESMGEKLVTDVAGIGETYGRRLTTMGFDKAYVLLGQFLVLKKNEELFMEWLKQSCGVSAHHSLQTFRCLSDCVSVEAMKWHESVDYRLIQTEGEKEVMTLEETNLVHLNSVSVRASVNNDALAQVDIIQMYENKFSEAIDVSYCFPIHPDGGHFTHFLAEIDGDVVKDVKKSSSDGENLPWERTCAENTSYLSQFNEYIHSYLSSSVLESKLAVCKLPVGSLKPRSWARIHIGYDLTLKTEKESNALRFTIPKTVVPLNLRQEKMMTESDDEASLMSRQEENCAIVSIKISLSVMRGKEDILESPSHPAMTIVGRVAEPHKNGCTQSSVRFSGTSSDMDRDFILLIGKSNGDPEGRMNQEITAMEPISDCLNSSTTRISEEFSSSHVAVAFGTGAVKVKEPKKSPSRKLYELSTSAGLSEETCNVDNSRTPSALKLLKSLNPMSAVVSGSVCRETETNPPPSQKSAAVSSNLYQIIHSSNLDNFSKFILPSNLETSKIILSNSESFSKVVPLLNRKTSEVIPSSDLETLKVIPFPNIETLSNDILPSNLETSEVIPLLNPETLPKAILPSNPENRSKVVLASNVEAFSEVIPPNVETLSGIIPPAHLGSTTPIISPPSLETPKPVLLLDDKKPSKTIFLPDDKLSSNLHPPKLIVSKSRIPKSTHVSLKKSASVSVSGINHVSPSGIISTCPKPSILKSPKRSPSLETSNQKYPRPPTVQFSREISTATFLPNAGGKTSILNRSVSLIGNSNKQSIPLRRKASGFGKNAVSSSSSKSSRDILANTKNNTSTSAISDEDVRNILVSLQKSNGSFDMSPVLAALVSQDLCNLRLKADNKSWEHMAWSTGIALEFFMQKLSKLKPSWEGGYERGKKWLETMHPQHFDDIMASAKALLSV